MTTIEKALKMIREDKRHSHRNRGLCEEYAILCFIEKILDKQVIIAMPKYMAEDGKCPDCGSENQNGNYCSACGRRLKYERKLQIKYK